MDTARHFNCGFIDMVVLMVNPRLVPVGSLHISYLKMFQICFFFLGIGGLGCLALPMISTYE